MLSPFREWPPTGGPGSGPSRKPECGCAQQLFKGRRAVACKDRGKRNWFWGTRLNGRLRYAAPCAFASFALMGPIDETVVFDRALLQRLHLVAEDDDASVVPIAQTVQSVRRSPKKNAATSAISCVRGYSSFFCWYDSRPKVSVFRPTAAKELEIQKLQSALKARVRSSNRRVTHLAWHDRLPAHQVKAHLFHRSGLRHRRVKHIKAAVVPTTTRGTALEWIPTVTDQTPDCTVERHRFDKPPVRRSACCRGGP